MSQLVVMRGLIRDAKDWVKRTAKELGESVIPRPSMLSKLKAVGYLILAIYIWMLVIAKIKTHFRHRENVQGQYSSLFRPSQQLIYRLYAGSSHWPLEEVQTMKTLVYSPNAKTSNISLTLTVPTYKIDPSMYFRLDVYSHEFEAEQITVDTESSNAPSVEQKQFVSASVPLFFTYLDVNERFQKRNFSQFNNAYKQISDMRNISENASTVVNISKVLKDLLEQALENPVQLIRRRVNFILIYEIDRKHGDGVQGRYHDVSLKYYKPIFDISQFWTVETDYIHPARIDQESIEVSIDFWVETAGNYRRDTLLKRILTTDFSLYFDNFTPDIVKGLIQGGKIVEGLISIICIVVHIMARLYCARLEAVYFTHYDSKQGIDWRHLWVQQFTPLLVVLTMCLRNTPFGVQLIYILAAYFNYSNRCRVVTLRFRRSWLFARVEMIRDQDLLPKSRTYAILTVSSLAAFCIIASVLFMEFSGTPYSSAPTMMNDMIYMLQFINSINALTMVVSMYRCNSMDRLPWRLLTAKGIVKILELLIFDINEYPSIRIINFARDDFILVASVVFMMFAYENSRYTQRMQIMMDRHRQLSLHSNHPDNSGKDRGDEKRDEQAHRHKGGQRVRKDSHH